MYIIFVGLYTFYYLFTFISDLVISFSLTNLFIDILLIALPIFIIIFLFKLYFSNENNEKNYIHYASTGGLVYYLELTFLFLVVTLFYYNCDEIFDFFSSILLLEEENIEAEISFLTSIAPSMLCNTLFYALYSLSIYRIYKNCQKRDIISYICISICHIVFITIGIVFLINNKINMFNGSLLYKEGYKNILLFISSFLEICMRLFLNIILIYYIKNKYKS